jgi:hypothetical protein
VSADGTVDGRLADVMSDIQMPLENLAYTIEAYLLANGAWLDSETRFLLAGVRDCADRVAGSARRVARQAPPRAQRSRCRERARSTAMA